MSMQLLTFFQLVWVALIYILVFILVPAAVFHRKFEGRPACVCFMAYLTIGNFYVMNLVFVLQLLKISSRTSLILGVVIPGLLAIAAMNWQSWVKASLVTAGETTHNVMVNTMGFRLLLTRIFQIAWQAIINIAKSLAESISMKWVDWIGTAVIMGLTVWQYGTNMFVNFGYTASDMLVHNYWINAMGEDNIFAAGVYPFGFHCVIYFMHAVFGVKTFVILRVFSIVETVLIHLMLLNILRLVCRMESVAYVAVSLYLLSNIWAGNSYLRYLGSLPQEYGMIFILPAIIFLLLFLRDRKDEYGEKGFRNDSTQMLILFGMNISMTLAAHFYDTIAVGIFCVAIAIGFFHQVFRKPYFWRIICCGLIALLIAVLPMYLAFRGGKPLEGSLRWGMSIVKGSTASSSQQPVSGRQPQLQDNSTVSQKQSSSTVSTDSQSASAVVEIPNKYRPWGYKLTHLISFINSHLQWDVFPEVSPFFAVMTLLMMGVGLVFGIVCLLQKETEQGSLLIANSVNLFFFSIVLISEELGIPALMDQNRCSIYLTYFLIVFIGLILDSIARMFLGWIDGEVMQRLVPLAAGAVLVVIMGLFGLVKMPARMEAFQKNGAIICVENILRENPKDSFTIISANDELRMTEEYGFHFEVYELLVDNLGNNSSGFLIVPTSKIYVFIEKIPAEYDESYENSGQPISRESASQPLPADSGISMYKGAKRHVVMSKLYYWAQGFRSRFENEMNIYYEDDEFICYEIAQNVDRPYDMSFVYGYNN